MQSHDDLQHRRDEFMRQLEERAESMSERQASIIAGGKPGEVALDEFFINGIGFRQLPPDEQGILRISIGGGSPVVNVNYCVYRGDKLACINLIRSVLKGLTS